MKNFRFVFSGEVQLCASEIWPDGVPAEFGLLDVWKRVGEYMPISEFIKEWNLDDVIDLDIIEE